MEQKLLHPFMWLFVIASFASCEIWRFITETISFDFNRLKELRKRNQQTIFMAAAEHGNAPIILAIRGSVSKDLFKELQLQTDRNKTTALHYACVFGDVKTVQLLADSDSVNMLDRHGRNPAWYAWRNGKVDAFYFLRKHYQVKAVSKSRVFEINRDACGWFACLMKLNELNPVPYSEKNDFGVLTKECELNTIKALVFAGCNPLLFFISAIIYNQEDAVEFILTEAPLRIERAITSREINPLIVAAEKRHFNLTKRILQFYESINLSHEFIRKVADSKGNSLLHLAALQSWEDFAFYLVDRFQFSWFAENAIGEPAIALAIFVGRFNFEEYNIPEGTQQLLKTHELYENLRRPAGYLPIIKSNSTTAR